MDCSQDILFVKELRIWLLEYLITELPKVLCDDIKIVKMGKNEFKII